MALLRLTFAGATLLASSAPGLSAVAATTTATIGISSTVQANCTVVVTPLVFGNYTGVALIGTATITPICTNTMPYTIGLGVGLGMSATLATRSMTAGGASLHYVLTMDARHLTNWGGPNLVGGGMALVAGVTPFVTTIYGLVAAGQFVAPGAYTDTETLTVTITY